MKGWAKRQLMETHSDLSVGVGGIPSFLFVSLFLRYLVTIGVHPPMASSEQQKWRLKKCHPEPAPC